MNAVLDQVERIIIELFKLEPEHSLDRLSADFIEAWDSLGHLRLIIKIEMFFAIRISQRDSVRLLSAEAIAKMVIQKTGLS